MLGLARKYASRHCEAVLTYRNRLAGQSGRFISFSWRRGKLPARTIPPEQVLKATEAGGFPRSHDQARPSRRRAQAALRPFPNGERPDLLFFGRRHYSDSVAQDYIIFEGTIVDFPTCLAPTAMTALKAELICGNFRSISRLISWLSISHRMQISENFRIIIIVIIKGRGTKRRLVYTFVLNCCLNSSTKIQPHGYCFFSPDMI